jgi:hypothetical protein
MPGFLFFSIWLGLRMFVSIFETEVGYLGQNFDRLKHQPNCAKSTEYDHEIIIIASAGLDKPGVKQ